MFLYSNKAYSKQIAGFMFIFTVIFIQVMPWYLGLLLGFSVSVLWKRSIGAKDIYIICLTYIIGFWLSEYIQSIFFDLSLAVEWKIIFSRLSLLGFLLPFFILYQLKRPKVAYLSIGSFRNTIYFPFIWWGIVKDPIWRFLLISSSIMMVSSIFVIDFKQEDFVLLFVYAGLFALVNSILEELLWRGFILSRFVSSLGEKFGLVIASIGFGFYHYSLEIPWFICGIFLIFGLFMGGLAIRSRGLVPVIIFHFLMNVLFVLGGLIF